MSIALDSITRGRARMRYNRHPDHPSLLALAAGSDHHSPKIEQYHGMIASVTADKRLHEVCPKPAVAEDQPCLPINERKVPTFDGVTLRIFNFEGDWIVSTATRVDARKASWASQSTFGVLMLDALLIVREGPERDNRRMQELFNEKLNKDHVYNVLLLHPQHTWIKFNPHPALILNDVYDRTTKTIKKNHDVEKDVLDLFTLPDNAQGFENKGYTWTSSDGRLCRWDAPDFVRAQELRLNRKNIVEAYLYQWPSEAKEFHDLFPWARPIFDWWSKAIVWIERQVYDIYRRGLGDKSFMAQLVLDPILTDLRKYVGYRSCTMRDVRKIVRTWDTLDFIRIVHWLTPDMSGDVL